MNARRHFLQTSSVALGLGVLPAVTDSLGVSNLSIAYASGVQKLSPEQQAAHLLNRLAFGARPGQIAEVAADPQAWIKRQLQPQTIPIPSELKSRLNDGLFTSTPLVDLMRDFVQAIRNNIQQQAQAANTNLPDMSMTQTNNVNQGNRSNPIAPMLLKFAGGAATSRISRAIESPQQLQEVMVDFWFNHFNIFQGKNLLRVMVGHYEHYAIRPFALGYFKDLLKATAHHPGMLYYLDNAQSSAPGLNRNRGLNENYARELMELHTLGVDSGYTQADVTALARILTGWSIVPSGRNAPEAPIEDVAIAPGRSDSMPGFWFNSRIHDNSEKQWMGLRIEGSGKAEGDFALDYLAKHPATAKHISYKLAQYFVSDQPADALVNRLAKVFTQSDGHIPTVLAELFASNEFWHPTHFNQKFKTPYHFVISSLRSVGASTASSQEVRIGMAQTAENQMQRGAVAQTLVGQVVGQLAGMGMPLYGCPTPDGYKNTEAAWLNPDGMTKRINFAMQLGEGRLGAIKLQSMPTPNQLLSDLRPVLLPTTLNWLESGNHTAELSRGMLLASPGFMRR